MSKQTDTTTQQVLQQAEQSGRQWDQLVEDVRQQSKDIAEYGAKIEQLVQDTDTLLIALGIDPTKLPTQ